MSTHFQTTDLDYLLCEHCGEETFHYTYPSDGERQCSNVHRDITEQDRIDAAKWDLEASFYVAVIETSAEILAHLEAMDVERRFAPVPEAPKTLSDRRFGRRRKAIRRQQIEDAEAKEEIADALAGRSAA